MVLGGCRSFHVLVTTGPQLTQCLRVNITFLMKVTCILIRWVLPNCKEMLVFFYFYLLFIYLLIITYKEALTKRLTERLGSSSGLVENLSQFLSV